MRTTQHGSRITAIAIITADQLDQRAIRSLVADATPDAAAMEATGTTDLPPDVDAAVVGEARAIEDDGTVLRAADVPCVALARTASPARVTRLLDLGARGVLARNASVTELRSALTAVTAGRRYVQPTLRMNDRTRRMLRQAPPCALDLVQLLALGFTNAEVAAGWKVTERTVEKHRAATLDSLRLDGRRDVVRWALEHGLLWPGMPDLEPSPLHRSRPDDAGQSDDSMPSVT